MRSIGKFVAFIFAGCLSLCAGLNNTSAATTSATITLVGSTASTGSVVTVPAGIQNGDLLLAFFSYSSSATATAPGGWQKLHTASASGSGAETVWYRFVHGDAPGSIYTWSFAGPGPYESGGMVAYRSVASTTFEDGFCTNQGQSATPSLCSFQTTSSGDLYVGFFATANTNLVLPADLSRQLVNQYLAGSYFGVGAAHKSLGGAGTVPAEVGSMNNGGWATVAIALKALDSNQMVAAQTATPTAIATVVATRTATPTPTTSRTATATAIATHSSTPHATVIATRTATPTPTPTPNVTAVWQLELTASGFEWIAPNGASMCKYAAVSTVDNTYLEANVVPGKYASWPSWASAQNARLRTWGFNAAGMYSYKYQTTPDFPVGGVPYAPTWTVSGHAVRDDFPYHCKNVNHNYGGMVCGSSFYQPFGGGQLDIFDKTCDSGQGVSAAFSSDVAADIAAMNSYGPSLKNAILIVTEEADDLYGINRTTHEDFGYIVAASNPNMPSSYTDGYSYSDQTLYAKMALRDFLATEYTTIAALNSAWGTSYTTFGTSDPNGDAGISNGTYHSYGTGTGLLDENGSHLIKPGEICSQMSSLNTWWPSAHPAVGSDLHNFVQYFAATYAQKIMSAWTQLTRRPPVFLPIYEGPSYVYSAIAPYLHDGDGLWIAPFEQVSEVQRIIAAAPKTPIIVADYAQANPDSPMIGHPCTQQAGDCYNSQELRGAGMVSYWQNTLHLKDATGRYTVVGLEHWGLYDQYNESGNFGLVTADHDNPYDGSADMAHGEPGNYGDSLTSIADFLNAGICDP